MLYITGENPYLPTTILNIECLWWLQRCI